jgi:hypothetical protein
VNLQETLALIEALRTSGVKRFKSFEHEIELSPSPDDFKVKKLEPLPEVKTPEEAAAVAKANEQIKGLLNTIKMSPEELANQIFPDGAL